MPWNLHGPSKAYATHRRRRGATLRRDCAVSKSRCGPGAAALARQVSPRKAQRRTPYELRAGDTSATNPKSVGGSSARGDSHAPAGLLALHEKPGAEPPTNFGLAALARGVNQPSAAAAALACLPASWRAVLSDEEKKPYFAKLMAFVQEERAHKQVFPPADDVFAAFTLTPYDDVKVLVLGQDPYHDDGQAHGLCFSVRSGTKLPPSLRNIFKELQADLGCTLPPSGDLTPWAKQGVLLLNAVLTVVGHKPASHKDQGWETFTDAVIAAVNQKATPVVFCLWGAYARKKASLIDTSRHIVIEGAHPSPLSAKKFLGSRPFSAINQGLVATGQTPIDWQLT